MRSLILALCALVCSFPVLAQGTDANLSSELVALHAKWMQAYYGSDPATMNQVEADDLVLVMPTGFVWHRPDREPTSRLYTSRRPRSR